MTDDQQAPWWRMRHYGLGRSYYHSYPAYAPKVLWHRFMHWAFGPLRGCSCSRCFHSMWRLEYPARDGYRDRLRIAALEDDVRALREAEALKRSALSGD